MVHAAALAATSQQLDALINGGMEESEKRCARIEDIEVDDFIRFCEYAYRGDYTVPPSETLSPPMPGNIQLNEGDELWGTNALSKKKKKGKKSYAALPAPIVEQELPPESSPEVIPAPQVEPRPTSRAPLRAEFNSRNYLQDGDPKSQILQRFEPKPNSTIYQNFTPVLLAHARLYCFAHVRIITPLKALTLHKLHKTLLSFKLYAERVGDIIELARYAYSNPDLPDRSEDNTLDALRKLVLEYIVCEIDTIGKSDEFIKYMEEGGEFVGDFWRVAKEYMV